MPIDPQHTMPIGVVPNQVQALYEENARLLRERRALADALERILLKVETPLLRWRAKNAAKKLLKELGL